MPNAGNADETPSSEPSASSYQPPLQGPLQGPPGHTESWPPGQPAQPGPSPPQAYDTSPAYSSGSVSSNSADYPQPGFARLDYPPSSYPPPKDGTPSGYPVAGYAPAPYPTPGYGPPQYGVPPMGYPDPRYFIYSQPRPATNTLALWSLITSMIGLPLLATWLLAFVAVITSIAGIVLGVLGLNQIAATGQSGRGLAIAGIVVGAGLLFLIVLGVAVVVIVATA